MIKGDTVARSAVGILGVNVSHLTLTRLANTIDSTIRDGGRATVLYANVHGLNLAWEQPHLRVLYNQSDYVLCDGFGVKLAARLLGQSLPERMTPPDWLPNVAALASKRGFSIFFLGNQPGVAERAVARLRQDFPDLHVAGVHHGFFEKTRGSADNEAVIGLINAAKPNLLYVGFGMPAQEYWLMENWDRLEVNVAITAGAMLDFIAGQTPRGPRWLTDHGLEWFTRLLTEPRRLWRRYLIGNPLFFFRVLRQRLGRLRFPEYSAAE
jgi:N-acetylglucosaminyldiphosphoundecaprenol N-acetyl-beta-D-mannosaminyltransferase